HALRTVALGGGCFFNRLLSERLAAQLVRRGLRVARAHAVSCGDAGLALGQAWVARQRLRGGACGADTVFSTPYESAPCV
ncbi:carbamoyltransferase HypF, partial [Burkholderia sp. LMU1-1-1.1]